MNFQTISPNQEISINYSSLENIRIQYFSKQYLLELYTTFKNFRNTSEQNFNDEKDEYIEQIENLINEEESLNVAIITYKHIRNLIKDLIDAVSAWLKELDVVIFQFNQLIMKYFKTFNFLDSIVHELYNYKGIETIDKLLSGSDNTIKQITHNITIIKRFKTLINQIIVLNRQIQIIYSEFIRLASEFSENILILPYGNNNYIKYVNLKSLHVFIEKQNQNNKIKIKLKDLLEKYETQTTIQQQQQQPIPPTQPLVQPTTPNPSTSAAAAAADTTTPDPSQKRGLNEEPTDDDDSMGDDNTKKAKQ